MRFACLISLTVMCTAVLFSSSFAQENMESEEDIKTKYVQVKDAFPNVYKKLDPKSDIIQKVKKGDFLELVSEGDSWLKVRVNGQTGFLERKAGKVVDKKGVSTITLVLQILVLLGCGAGVFFYFKKQKAALSN
ncbi:MAG: hypothetical protein ACLFQB_11830 [Chitinispirillaceae bacterium]